nr:leucine-rich repeat extensin-like protein 5 [Aedes albopictus]
MPSNRKPAGDRHGRVDLSVGRTMEAAETETRKLPEGTSDPSGRQYPSGKPPPPTKQPPKTTTKPGRTPKETSSGLWIPTFNPVVGTSGLSDFRDPSSKTYPKRPPTNTPHNLDQPGRTKLSLPPDTGPLHSTRSWAPRPSRIPRDPSGKPHPKRPSPTRPQPRPAWSEEPDAARPQEPSS